VIISSLSSAQLGRRLSESGLAIHTGPFVISLHSSIDSIARGVEHLYGDFSIATDDEFIDFRLDLSPSNGLRRWIRPQVQFSFDGLRPFVPLPLNHAFPMFEWALNWCVAKHAHQYLIIHAAVLERNGQGLIMPGPPGAGKSTLCAVLANRGWRLLTDELALVSLEDGMLVPLPRPVSLKNESIDIVRQYAPDAIFGDLFLDTKKGTVAHMRPSLESVQRADDRAQPGWIIMPRYLPGSATSLHPASKGEFGLHLANNSFNYSILHLQGFEALSKLMEATDCYNFRYSDLDSAVELFNQLEPPTR
jgi:HprK-related kinase A